MDIDNVLVPNKISSGEKNYKYFIVYMDDGHKIKSLWIMLSKTSTYVKCSDGETKWMSFWLKMINYWKNVMIFGIKSAMV